MPTPDKADQIEQMLAEERQRRASEPLAPPQSREEAIDTYTPMMCVAMDDDARWAEYVRVRMLLSDRATALVERLAATEKALDTTTEQFRAISADLMQRTAERDAIKRDFDELVGPLRAQLTASEQAREAMRTALEEVLSRFAPSDVLRQITPYEAAHVRKLQSEAVVVADVYRWRAALAAAQTPAPER